LDWGLEVLGEHQRFIKGSVILDIQVKQTVSIQLEVQNGIIGTRIDPGHRRAAGRNENNPGKQDKDSAAVSILKLAGRHVT
jgi:hypothetical protein